MEKFEIHITGSEVILERLHELGLKSLHATMRNPANEVVGIEFMSSFTKLFSTYENCKAWVDSLVTDLENKGVDVYRVKIECPYFLNQYRDQSVYIEAHFPTNSYDTHYPFVYNVKSCKYVSTDRVYLKSEYDSFISKWRDVDGVEIEYCLFDDNIRHDDIWIKSFKK